jgi:type 1 glutamine amidotransferase
MRTSKRRDVPRLAAWAILAAAVGAVLGLAPRAEDPPVIPLPPAKELPRVLVFSKTAGFRHDSIPDGIAALREIGAGDGNEPAIFAIDATEDAAAFTGENLKKYACIVFLSTTGNVLDESQQAAFEGYIKGGGGYAGIHAASDTEFDWPWYGKLVGAYFVTHPEIQPATIFVENRTHPSTRHLGDLWQRTDEWYVFDRNPRPRVRVLLSLDESSYKGGGMGGDHPIAWCHEFDGGRAWYTGGGHTSASFGEPKFREHLKGGILWAGRLPGGEERPAGPPPSRGPAPATPAPSDDPSQPNPLSHPAP